MSDKTSKAVFSIWNSVRIKRGLMGLALILFAVAPSAQQDPRVRDSDTVILAKVVGKASFWKSNDYGDNIIVTNLDLNVESVIKGKSNPVVVLEVPGGTVGDTTLEVSSQTPISVGDKAIFYFYKGKHTATQNVSSSGFLTTGHAWAVNQVNYFVNPTNIYFTSDQAIAAAQFAANDWNTQAQGPKLTYAGTTSGGSLTLDYTNNVFFRNDVSPNGYIAETYWWWNGTGNVIDADIVFHENYGFQVHGLPCVGYYVEDVGTHEFGHVLGLGHSTVPTATMYPTTGACTTDHESLDPDDIAGIAAIYPVVPPPPPPPAPKPCHGKKCGA